MKKYGRSAVSDFLGDNLVYRNLVPVDPSLPSLPEIWEEVGLSSSRVPRKTSLEYARVIAYQLQYLARFKHLDIKRVVFIGDTRLNDGNAFLNICRAGGWSGMAFIAAEDQQPVKFEVQRHDIGKICFANRWSTLTGFDDMCIRQDFPLDEGAVILLDLDKTTLGARGRNDKVIDQVRVLAAHQTISDLLGEGLSEQVFFDAYQQLNQPQYHPFTTDNQDYLVYICMILAGELITLEVLGQEVKAGKMESFEQFLSYTERHQQQLPANLRQIHEDVYNLVRRGDPTPFKEFRYQEYKQTVAHMGQLVADTPVEELLNREITITHEVRNAALRWRENGALLFGLSDKPDEASIPGAELASQGYQALHRVETEIVGA